MKILQELPDMHCVNDFNDNIGVPKMDTVERVAKAMAYAVKQPNDACTSEDEYWLHTGQLGQETWKQAARAAISAMPSPDVGEAARVMADKLSDPFRHPDMNKNDINWQAVWNAFWEEADERDAPGAMVAALTVISTPPKEDV